MRTFPLFDPRKPYPPSTPTLERLYTAPLRRPLRPTIKDLYAVMSEPAKVAADLAKDGEAFVNKWLQRRARFPVA